MTDKDFDGAISKAKAALTAAAKVRRTAEAAFKRAEKAEEAIQEHLDDLQHARAVAKQTRADLAGKHGVVFTLLSAPKTLFDEQRTQQFVIVSSDWLLGNEYRFRVRAVGDAWVTYYIDVSTSISGNLSSDWQLPRATMRGVLEAAIRLPRGKAPKDHLDSLRANAEMCLSTWFKEQPVAVAC